MQPTQARQSGRQPVHNKEHRLPNLYWRSMHMDSLRCVPRVISLPPVQQLEVCSSKPATFRYVRQHTALWGDLHCGLVTTGRLKQALGMHEDQAAKVVGFSKAMRGSHYLQSAWAHALLEQPCMDSSHEDPVAHNEAARQAFNSTSTALSTSTATASNTAMKEAKKRNCEAAAMGGNAGTRMAWGMVQEAAAAHCLLHIFPHCSIEEVGLFQVDAGTLLPGNWAAATAQLPAMGASPDTLIMHTLQLTAADFAEAVALPDGSDSSSTGTSRTSGSTGSGQGSSMASSRASNAARLLLTRGLSRVAVAGSSGASSNDTSSNSSTAATGQADGTFGNLHSSACSSLAAPAVEQVLLEQLQQWQAANSNAGSVTSSSPATRSTRSSSGGSAGLQDNLQLYTISVTVREVVEVKNHCPFIFRHRRRGAKGRLSINFALRDRGPVEGVRPEWVPQLQLHMLATGCMSALLVSRSATKGMRVFRLWRDDAYLDAMLTVLAGAKAHCLANGKQPPPASALLGQPGHMELLHQTVALAAGAVCVADVAGSQLQPPPGSDTFAFWPS